MQNMGDLGDMVTRRGSVPEPVQVTGPNGIMTAKDAMRAATGLDIDPDTAAALPSAKAEGGTPARRPMAAPKPVSVPGSSAMDGFMSAEEAERLGLADKGEKINLEHLAAQNEAEREAREEKYRHDQAMDMFSEVIASEDERLAEQEKELSTEEGRKKVMDAKNGVDGTGGPGSAQVYERPLDDEDEPVRQQQSTVEGRIRDQRQQDLFGQDPINTDDLLPAYTEDDEEEEKEPEATDPAPPNPSDEAYGDYIRSLDVAIPEDTPSTAITKLKDAQVVSSDRGWKDSKSMGDSSFMTMLNKFKKDHFGKVTAYLVNSGFSIDMVGTGVVDLQQLYMNVDRNMRQADYEIELMRAVIKGITGTHPKINPNSLRNMIHFADYQMMAYAEIAATLKSVETVTNCQECGNPFRITAVPTQLLMNMDELEERVRQIEAAPNVESVSLLTSNRQYLTELGITVTIGHPSYNEYIRITDAIRKYADTLQTNSERQRFSSMVQMLYMIRKIQFPNGVTTSTVVQNYQTLLILTQTDFDRIDKIQEEMRKDIVIPRFGIKKVKCPHCGKMNTDIAFENLTDLLFFHTMVTGYVNGTQT